MNYISAEEFLKQPVEVQKVFKDWWKPQKGDLYAPHEFSNMVRCLECDGKSEGVIANPEVKDKIFPLLTECQLRQFIEDKTGCKIETVWISSTPEYYITLVDNKDSNIIIRNYFDLGEDLLQAYWKVAIEIAEEEQKEHR